MGQLDHVERFLSPLDTRGTFLKVAALLAAPPDESKDDLAALGAWVEKEAQQLGAHTIHARILGNAGETTLLAVGYLRGQAGLQAHAARLASDPNELKKTIAEAKKLVDTLEPNFISELLLETERRAGRDPAFAHKLSTARDDIRWLAAQLVHLQPPHTGAQPPTAASAQKTVDRGTLILVACIVLGLILGGAAKK